MRKKKISHPIFEALNPLVVEPNNSLTPRQILQQFGQGAGLVFHDSSDDISDERFSDDEMVDNTISFEDEMEAADFMSQPMFPVHETQNDSLDEPQASKPKPGSQFSLELGVDEPSGDD